MIVPAILSDQDQLKCYFEDCGLGIVSQSSGKPKPGVNEMIQVVPYQPDLKDLYRLHQFILQNKRTTVLEFGVGWSTLVFAHAIDINRKKFAQEVKKLRRNNPFEVHSVDNEQSFIDVAQKRIPESLGEVVHFYHASVSMVFFQGRYATEYEKLPLVNPDFIYLDGPDQFNIINNLNGFSTAHKDMMPMSCDILKFEHFLTPGTIIVVDGRAANARFLKTNFQRGWTHSYDEEFDQHVFVFDEEPLGKYNRKQLEFYADQ